MLPVSPVYISFPDACMPSHAFGGSIINVGTLYTQLTCLAVKIIADKAKVAVLRHESVSDIK